MGDIMLHIPQIEMECDERTLVSFHFYGFNTINFTEQVFKAVAVSGQRRLQVVNLSR
jgi:hypothetical protein